MSNNFVGILELSCGKTYGRQIKTNKKEGKLFYGIYHEYENLPYFKAAYEIKYDNISRHVKDKYVIFNCDNNSSYNQSHITQRPEVKLIETIGNIDDEYSFSKYRTLKSGLKLSPSWTKEFNYLRKQIEQVDLINSSVQLCQTEQTEIFTIDPEGCKDMDDGIGIKSCFDKSNDIYDISIAITHVPMYLISSKISSQKLINTLSNTCSIYLPDNVINMIPKIFAEHICSFIKNNDVNDDIDSNDIHKTLKRPALVLHIFWNNSTNNIVKHELKIENIIVKHNFVYDTQELLTYQSYIMLFDIVNKIIKQKSFDACQTIHDSHDVVAYLMTYMNFYVMEWLETRNVPCIYRINQKRNIKQLPQNLQHLERKIGNYAGEYSIDKPLYNESKSVIWTHITSPMRRLADLTNMISISLHLYPAIFEPLKEFRDYCLTITSRINNEYKISRRISLDCELFSSLKQKTSNIITDKIYEGIIIDKHKLCYNKVESLNYNSVTFTIYIDEISRMFDVNMNDTTLNSKIYDKTDIYDIIKCKILLFDDGYNIKQKVRIMIM